jgi:phosphoserine aminotransferase
MNLMAPGATADYLDTGVWAQLAIKEANKAGPINVASCGEPYKFVRLPRQDELTLSPNAAYVHLTSNNTDYGTQWTTLPEVGDIPIVTDSTSDILSRPIDVSQYGLIYAGAQKNLGPSGLTVVIVREDLVQRSAASLPAMLSYRVHADHNSIFNTPPIFSVYVLRLMAKWLVNAGGLESVARVNARKAAKLYAEVDRSGFYRGIAQPDCRSTMNVTFRVPSETLETLFVEQGAAEGLDGLAGHPIAPGGLRASIYNAVPEDAVDALVQFMREFERTHG